MSEENVCLCAVECARVCLCHDKDKEREKKNEKKKEKKKKLLHCKKMIVTKTSS